MFQPQNAKLPDESDFRALGFVVFAFEIVNRELAISTRDFVRVSKFAIEAKPLVAAHPEDSLPTRNELRALRRAYRPIYREMEAEEERQIAAIAVHKNKPKARIKTTKQLAQIT